MILSAIESECHFVQVGGEMLRTDFVPASHDAALQERESGLDGVGVNIRSTSDVFFMPVIYGFVPLAEFPESARVGWQFARNDYIHVLGDILLDVLRKRARLGIFGVEESQIAVALTDANDCFFVGAMQPAPVFASATQFAADVGFVHLNRAVEHRANFLHGRTDAMAEIPRCFVAHAEGALNLARGHSFLRFAEQERGEKPLVERQVRVIENRSSGDGELVIAFLAVVERLFGFQFDSGHLAARAFRASGPAQPCE